MPHARTPAAFEHVQKSRQVGFGVDVRILDRIAHARLRRQMDDVAEGFARKHRLHRGAVGDIDLRKLKLRMAL